MKILIFGASGNVGSAIFQALSGGYETYGTYNQNKPASINEFFWRKLDIADADAASSILNEIQPAVIISSLTGDFLRQTTAHKIMADYLKETGGRMVFISTVNVFDGLASGGNDEAALPYPISQYGSFKQSTEEMLLWELGSSCLIARLPKIITGKEAEQYAKHIQSGKGFYSNLYFNINSPANVASAVKFCLEANKSGIVHLTGNSYISDKTLAEKIIKNAGLSVEFETLTFTNESICAALGCDDVSRLKPSNDGGFYLTMTNTSKELQKYCEFFIPEEIK